MVDADKLPGWYFTLDADEKLITEPFTLSGVTFFTVFEPLEVRERRQGDKVCALGGESKIFVVNTVTTEGYAVQAGADRPHPLHHRLDLHHPAVRRVERHQERADQLVDGDTPTPGPTSWRRSTPTCASCFPPGARFANYTLDIKTIRSDTGIVFIAPVPVAIEPHNWKEF